MEKFEINENGTLTAYHNDDKDITELTVPDGVIKVPYGVLDGYKNLQSITLPDCLESISFPHLWELKQSITYRGVNFPYAYEPVETVIEMIADKDYSTVLPIDLKYHIIIQIYFNDGDTVTESFIKRNFKKFFVFLIEENDFATIEKLIKSGKFISKRNINTYIKLADEKECYEVFDMLEEYKEKNNF